MFIAAVGVAVLVNAYRFLSTVRAFFVFKQRKKEPGRRDGTETDVFSTGAIRQISRVKSLPNNCDAGARLEWWAPASFGQYLLYHVGNWMNYSTYPSLRILVEIFSYMLIIGTLLYLYLADESVGSSLYQIFVWLVAPDGGNSEHTIGGMIVGATTSLWGLLFFALLMTVLGQAFEEYIGGLRTGTTPVLEAEHIVILGFTEDTVPLVRELSAAHADLGGTTIAILCPLPKPEVERRLNELGLLVGDGLKGSRVMVRTGFPHRPEDLKLVSVDLCRTAIPMPDRTLDKDVRDVYMLQVVSAVRSRDWPLTGQILVFYSVEQNVELFEEIGGSKASVVNLDTLLSSVAVSCSQQKSTASVISEIVAFEGSDLHIAAVPRWLRDKTLAEMEPYFPHCTILGVIDKVDLDDVELCPDFDVKVEKGKELIVLAEDLSSASPRQKPLWGPAPPPSGAWAPQSSARLEKSKQEHVLIIGWSHLVGSVLVHLDRLLPPGSRVSSFAESDPAARKVSTRRTLKRHLKVAWTNIQIFYYKGQPGSSYSLQEAGWSLDRLRAEAAGEATFPTGFEMPTPVRSSRPCSPEAAASIPLSLDGLGSDTDAVRRTESKDRGSICDALAPGIHWEDITRVFVMSETVFEPWRSDAFAMAAAKQVTLLVPQDTPVVVELQDTSSRHVCEHIGLEDVVSSSKLPAQVMAALSLQPRLKEVYFGLLGRGQYEIRIVNISHYFDRGELPATEFTACFSSVAAMVRLSGDVLVGWRVGGLAAVFDINPPDKHQEVTLTAGVDLVVVTRQPQQAPEDSRGCAPGAAATPRGRSGDPSAAR